jgi:hypothetical protein
VHSGQKNYIGIIKRIFGRFTAAPKQKLLPHFSEASADEVSWITVFGVATKHLVAVISWLASSPSQQLAPLTRPNESGAFLCPFKAYGAARATKPRGLSLSYSGDRPGNSRARVGSIGPITR